MKIPSARVDYVPFNSDRSLMDADIIVFRPDISDTCGFTSETHEGKPSLSDDASFRLKDRIRHWKRELDDALASGKTIFFILAEKKEVVVASGQVDFSGTGRSARRTRYVLPCNNFECLPQLGYTSCSGEAMRLSEKADIIADYWRIFGDLSNYKAKIDGKVSARLIVSKDGTQTLGAMVRWKDISGTQFILPNIDFDNDRMIALKKGAYEWTKEAVALGNQMVSAFEKIDADIRSNREVTPMPDWVSAKEFELAAESKLREELLGVEASMQKLTEKRTQIQTDIRTEIVLKNLVFEKGAALERAILKGLELLGFSAKPYKDSSSEFDAVFESTEGRLLGEAEGKDTKAINIDKMRQLEMNIHEDFERDDVTSMAKGVLFGNAFRLSPLAERGEFFTEKCLTAAQRSGCALVKTPDLFKVAQYLSANSDAEFARQCRKALVETSGQVVKFPDVPVTTQIDITKSAN
jgi:hypothetical protein